MGNCLSKELAWVIAENDDTAAYPYRPYSKVRMITDFNLNRETAFDIEI